MGVDRECEQLQQVSFCKDVALVARTDFHHHHSFYQQLINKGREHKLVNKPKTNLRLVLVKAMAGFFQWSLKTE